MRLAPPLAVLALVTALAGCSAAPPSAGPADVDCAARATEFGDEQLDPGGLPEPYAGLVSTDPDCLRLAEPGKYVAEWWGVSEAEAAAIADELRAAAEADGLEHTFGENGDDELWSVQRDGDIDSIMMSQTSSFFELETDFNTVG